MNKSQLKQALLDSVDAEIAAAIDAATAAQESASHEDNQPENQYDTLSLEAAYLAHGQSERILGLQQLRIQLGRWQVVSFDEDDAIGCGALVGRQSLENDTAPIRWVWIVLNGGRQLQLADEQIQVVSAQTPLAKALLGKELGDEVTMNGQGWEVVSIS